MGYQTISKLAGLSGFSLKREMEDNRLLAISKHEIGSGGYEEKSETCMKEVRDGYNLDARRLAIKKPPLIRSKEVTLSLIPFPNAASKSRSMFLQEVYALGCSVLLVKLLYTIPVPLIPSPAVSIKIPGASIK
jgi:hypothetical protein